MKNKKNKDLKTVESTYWTEITFTCPRRGTVTQKVEIKRLKSQPTPESVQGYELEILKDDQSENEK
jgi:hypothetical protein